MKKKLWVGNQPDQKTWVKVCDLGEFDGVNWILFENSLDLKSEWNSYKLVADGMVATKANYRIAWNGERFSIHNDIEILREFRPDLFKEVCKAIEEAYA